MILTLINSLIMYLLWGTGEAGRESRINNMSLLSRGSSWSRVAPTSTRRDDVCCLWLLVWHWYEVVRAQSSIVRP